MRQIPKEPDALTGAAKFLLHLYGEELEIRVGVSPIESMAAEIHVKFGARWQPDCSVTLRKEDRLIINCLMIQP